jgi:hypothetical protein
MNYNYDEFVKEHLQAILNEAIKEHALCLVSRHNAQLKVRLQHHKDIRPCLAHNHHEHTHHEDSHVLHPQDNAISTSYTHNQP